MGHDNGSRISRRRVRSSQRRVESADDGYESEKFVRRWVRKLKKLGQRQVRNSRQ